MLHSFLSALRRRILLLSFIPALAFLFCSGYYYRTNHSFLSFTNTLFQNEITQNTLNLHYTLKDPSAFGIKDYPVTLGNADPESLTESYLALKDYQSALLRIPYKWLSHQNRLTYDILKLCFETQLQGEKYLLYQEPLGPSLGTQAQLPILLAEYSFHSEKDIEDYLALLLQIPKYFDGLLQFEYAKSDAGLFMNDTIAQSIIDQCKAFLDTQEENILFTTFKSRIETQKNLTDKEKQNYILQNEEAVKTCVLPAYEKLAEGISSLKGTGKNELGLCYFPEGKSYYTYLIKDLTGCYNSVDDILKRIQKQISQDIQDLRTLVQRNPSLLSDTGIEALQNDTSSISGDPQQILLELQSKMSSDFPDLPDVSCDIKYVEKSLEDYLSPAFYLTAPLDDPNQNVIYINPGAGYEGLDLYSTLAHEGYPGHLYQTVFSASSGCHPVRSLLNFGGYVEGWATYVEMLSFSYADVESSTAELYRINRSLTLGISSILDIYIHYYGYSREQAASLLARFGFTDEDTVDSFFNIILEAPANYLKYYLGYLCFKDLQNASRKIEGDSFRLKNFHKKILEIGPCPFPVLYSYM